MSTATNRNNAQKRKPKKANKHAPIQQARLIAVQMLYAFEQKSFENDQALFIDAADGVVLKDDAKKQAQKLFEGFCQERTAIDACVDKRLQNWTLDRLAVMDRAVLRMGCYELLYCSHVPPRVAINEYIELAKQFGSEERTAKLVNGVLDNIAREHRPDEVKTKK